MPWLVSSGRKENFESGNAVCCERSEEIWTQVRGLRVGTCKKYADEIEKRGSIVWNYLAFVRGMNFDE